MVEEGPLTCRSLDGSSHRELSHWSCYVDGRRGCCLKIILMEGTDHFPQVLNCRCRLPGALLSFLLSLSPSLPFGPLPRHQSLDIGDQVTSPCRRLSTSLPFGPLFGHQSLDIGDQDNFSSPSPLPGSGERVKAEAVPERQISGRWPASDFFANVPNTVHLILLIVTDLDL